MAGEIGASGTGWPSWAIPAYIDAICAACDCLGLRARTSCGTPRYAGLNCDPPPRLSSSCQWEVGRCAVKRKPATRSRSNQSQRLGNLEYINDRYQSDWNLLNTSPRYAQAIKEHQRAPKSANSGSKVHQVG